MTTATVANVRGTERAVSSWLASTGWAVVLGAASGSACVAVRLFFRALQWIFVQQTGTFLHHVPTTSNEQVERAVAEMP
jgi:CIC family chloride channel protein